MPRAARARLTLEQLELRDVPAVVWSGAAGNGLWTDGGNWVGGAAPAATDDALIDVPGQVTVTISADVSIRSVTSAEGITVSPGRTLTVTGAGTASVISGAFTVAGAALVVSGTNTTLDVTGATSADGTSFLASAGATLALPALTAVGAASGTWRAEGAGSALDLRNVTGVVANGGLIVEALSGGRVDLRGAASLNTLFGQNRFATVKADGTGSVVELSALTTFTDPHNDNGFSHLVVTNSGELVAPNLTTVHADLTLDGTGVMPVAQITSLKNGVVTLTGASRTFSSLTDGSGYGPGGSRD